MQQRAMIITARPQKQAKFSSKDGLLIHSLHKGEVQQKESTELKLWNDFASL